MFRAATALRADSQSLNELPTNLPRQRLRQRIDLFRSTYASSIVHRLSLPMARSFRALIRNVAHRRGLSFLKFKLFPLDHAGPHALVF